MAILFFVLVINILLGLFVFARNTKSLTNFYFLLLVGNICAWSFSSYFTDHASSESLRLYFAKAAFVFPIAFSFILGLFSKVFPLDKKYTLREKVFLSSVTIFGVSISISNLVVEGIRVREDGTDILPGILYNAYTVVVLLLFSFAVKNYFTSRKQTNFLQQMQTRFMATGLFISFVWALAFNVLLPLTGASWGTAKFGPIGTIFFVGATAYAIIRHKLFDIRLIVARSLGYVLSLGSLVMVTLFILFFASEYLERLGLTAESLRFFYVIMIIILSMSYQPVKRFFDKATNSWFYQDAYDVQALLDNLNKVLISTIELDKLLLDVSKVIGHTLKADFCLLGIKEVNNTPIRIIGYNNRGFSEDDVHEVRRLTPKTKTKVIVIDELEEEHNRLKVLTSRNNVAMIARLTDTPHSEKEGLGYIIMGVKKSGNPYSSNDVRVLEIISDELVIAIQNALRFEEIQNFARTLEQKVDEATSRMREANEKLKKLDQTKDDFISMASHQLRTPLTSVKGYVSMVLEGDTGKITAQQRKLLDQAFISSQRMVYLIADLLNVSRLRTGKFIIEAKPTNLSEVVEGEISQLIETAKGRGLNLTYKKPKDFPELMLDETKIRQVIMNFCDNAIYYTPTGGNITVELTDTGQSIEFTVTDDGIGVPKAEQHHLFNKFYRAGNAKKARPDGTGLGLFMAKKVVVAQGGAIIFKTQEGKGSTFGFTFSKSSLSPQHYRPNKTNV